MKNSIANVDARRESIVSKLQQNEQMSVKNLAHEFAVSLVTIRRDLKVLQQMGQITWTHGRVQAVLQPDADELLNDKSSMNHIKDCIAKAEPEYIKENSTLFVNSSSLCWRMINQLAIKPLTIITNNLRVTECARHPETSIIMTGGEVRYPKESLVGTIAVQFLETMQSDYTLIGCDGISLDEGLTTHNIYESQVNSTMVQRTKQKVICVADYRKVGVSSNYHVADLDQIDVLITDTFANERVVRSLRKSGIEVIQVSV
ncbi:DeoR/GlpR transcriptional regulator [Bombilactobacillus bombi]|uniref:DeoR/GlpR transcriptional regulator n=1 Tax=Bombilactobacillus bombi TaxID=1303590 RepID=A0A3R6YQM6_9LACO|nr:DeoR/GlpR family DNA-binding transcription regulator [Bombilactobacillus bombi]RHW48627.1 DeoR/GlpR transcriptional regulator [Bombilactobacillus bombi]